jgi:Domain of unknown function (DUF4159)/Aerotolerance regulator N-terminal
MIAGIPLAFAEPLVLLGLLSLPILWWLLRLVPPRPRRIDFPPTRMLFDIIPKEETPSRTPWWLTLLRLTLAALVIIAAAGPLWNPPVATTTASAPLLLLIDDGFAAANTWDARMRTTEDLIARAEADGRGVAVVPLSVTNRDISLETPGAARARLRLVQPKPHAVERTEAIPALERFLMGTPDVEIVWLSDGVDAGHAADFVVALARIADKRPITVVDGGLKPARALAAADNAAGVLSVKVLRTPATGDDAGTVRALDLKGLPLGEASFSFRSSERETDAQLDLPVEIRNDIARIEIEGERSAGAVQLLDKRWRRRTVGVITGSTADTAQPLLASTFYLSRALSPFADVRLADRGSPAEMVNQFVEQRLPMIILADVGTIAGDARDRLTRWIDDGGVLVRFAGPRLAAADDDLVPVRLRRGGRILGGSLSWDQPQQLAGFSRESPFNGMLVPNDVTVNRQVLAEPDAGLSDHTWAMLGDGTPLVTAGRKGKGMIVLFHVTADTKWSDLPLSGAFVDMLKRIVGISGATASTEANAATGAPSTAREAVPPTRVLDGFGSFEPPPPTARPVPAGYAGRATGDNPPGFYGPPEGLVAVNTLAPADRLEPIDYKPLDPRFEYFRTTEPQDLRGPVFMTALVLLLIDALVVFWLAGGIYRLLPRRGIATSLLIAGGVALALAVTQGATRAADAAADQFAARSTFETHLAYVVTGDSEADSVSKSGLTGLTTFLAQRTALEAGDPIGVDLESDELAFFPIIYWPIVPGAKKPTPQALARVDAYMKQGGTVLFDTKDAVLAPPGPGGEARSPGMLELRAILSSLDLPELEPVPRDHVLTKTFFLLRDFPGRFTTGQLWVEALQSAKDEEEDDAKRPARGGDGVSSIIITSNDLAGAWATRPDGQAMLPLVPGEPRQRDFAFRAGVNIVMYVLTGNYKADQVHVPALLERLGQ